MPFEFAFLDWLCQFRNPVMNAISDRKSVV